VKGVLQGPTRSIEVRFGPGQNRQAARQEMVLGRSSRLLSGYQGHGTSVGLGRALLC